MFVCGLRAPSAVKLLVSCSRDMSTVSTQSAATAGKDGDNRSVHSDTVESVHNVPLNVLIRPIPPVLDELKVQSLMETVKVTKGLFSM